MEQEHDTLSGQSGEQQQEQNYDYIFDEIEKQNTLQSGEILLIDKDGNPKKATGPSVMKVFAPIFIFLAAMAVIVIASKFSDMLAIALAGVLFMAASGWTAFTRTKKFRPHPILVIVFIVGAAMVYSAAATMIHRRNPFFDMELFQIRSTLGFGIGVLLYGAAMLANIIFHATTCRTEIMAKSTKIQQIGYQNGKPFGTVTWTYDYEGVSYTETTYNTLLTMLGEGEEAEICIDPDHPNRLRRKSSSALTGWAIFFIIAGVLMIGCYAIFV